MHFILLLPLLIVNLTAEMYQPVGQTLSIVSLAMSIPHNLLLRDHCRSLSFLQTNYLILNYTGNSTESYSKYLEWSVLKFIPNGFNRQTDLYREVGGSLIFTCIVVLLLAICYVVFLIERRCGSDVRFAECWLVFRSLIDWVYLILIAVALKHLMIALFKSDRNSDGLNTIEFSTIGLVFLGYFLYHLVSVLYPYKDLSQEEQAAKKKQKIVEFVSYMRFVCLSICSLYKVLEIEWLVYGYYLVFVLHLGLYYAFNNFNTVWDKVVFVLNEVACITNLTLVITQQNIEYSMITIIAITSLQSVLEIYRIYRAIRYRNKKVCTVHPQVSQDVNIVDVQSLPQQKQIQKQADKTQIQLDLVSRHSPLKKTRTKRKRLFL